jgi:hypothetical protein
MAKRKRTNNDLQKTTQKAKDRVARTPLKTGIELMYSGRVSRSCSTRNTRRVTLVTKPVICHEWLRQVSRGHLWHRYSVAVNQVMVVIVKLSSDDFNLTNRNPWFSNFLILVSTNPLSKKYRYEPLSLEYRINWEIYTPYAGTAGMLLR